MNKEIFNQNKSPGTPSEGAPQSFYFSDFFIHRPVFSWVVNFLIIMLGLTAFLQLPTREYPVMEQSRVKVIISSAQEMSPKIAENQITAKLEDDFSSVKGLHHIWSSTSGKEIDIILTFKDRSTDIAAADVREILSQSIESIKKDFGESQLETNIIKGGGMEYPCMILSLTSPTLSPSYIFDVAEKNIKNSLESIDGVASVQVYGSHANSMMIYIDPLKVMFYQLNLETIRRQVKDNNFQQSIGRIIENDRDVEVTANMILKTPKEFGNIILSNKNNKLVRLEDIAEVKLAPSSEIERHNYFNGRRSISIAITPQSNANVISISDEVQKRLKNLEKIYGKDIAFNISSDDSVFVKTSLHHVYQALFEAIVLVLLVVLFFLRSLRASFIPLIAIPVSLIGSFFLMKTMGFTINILTLLSMVLAIGLVVDDAIVVLENIYRYLEEGMTPLKASILGTREVSFSVIAMTLTLVAVYAPLAIAPGEVGKIFKEFALTLAGSVLLSGITALTLSPAMCAKLLKSGGGHKHNPRGNNDSPLGSSSHSGGFLSQVSQKIENTLTFLDRSYERGVYWTLNHKILTLFVSLGFTIFSFLWAATVMKKELSPSLDQGIVSIEFTRPPGRSDAFLNKNIEKIDKILSGMPYLQHRTVEFAEKDIRATLTLYDWAKRPPCHKILEVVNKKINDNQDLEFTAECVSSSPIQSQESSFPFSIQLLTDRSAEELSKRAHSIKKYLSEIPGIETVDWSTPVTVPSYAITFRDYRIHQLGINPREVSDVLSSLLGRGFIVGTFEKDGSFHRVLMESNSKTRSTLENILNFNMTIRDERNGTKNIPLGELIDFHMEDSSLHILRNMKKRSYNIRAIVKQGYGAINVYRDFEQRIQEDGFLPEGYEIKPAGEIKTYLEEQGAIVLIFVLAICFIFLIMAAQFESIADPLIILFTVPLALSGAIFSLIFIKGGSINVYSQIGLITLIGLITKHGILLVDFANQRRLQGSSLYNSIIEACGLRLRPILMTTFAMVFGSLPLAFASGAGSEARRQIGTTIAGGMTIGTLFTLFVIPIIYILVNQWFKGSKDKNIQDFS